MAEREKYRPVSRRLWDDHAFLSLGDDGRMVWLYLLTCPALPIPGVILGGPAAHAERLGWSTDRYMAGLAEVQRAGIPVRTEGRLTWLERALHHQPASNPNTVKGWGRWWCDVPPGPLKAEIWAAVRAGCNGFTDVFFEQFGTVAPSWNGSGNGSGNGYPNGLPNGSGNGLGNPSGNRLPQDQDQDQDQDQEQGGCKGGEPPRAVALTPTTQPVKARTKRAKAPETPLPADWAPNAAHREQAARLGVDPEREAGRYRDHAEAHGRRLVSWDAGFRTWLDRSRDFTPGARGASPAPVSTFHKPPPPLPESWQDGPPEWVPSGGSKP